MKLHTLEFLESRIAPATLLPGGRGVSYVDVDGDLVTVTVSKGPLSAANFEFDTAFADSGPQQLQTLLLKNADLFAGVNVTVTAKAVGGVGNGLANVGFLDAKDVDLGTVKIAGDLGRVVAGDADPSVVGVKSLSVASMGLFGTSTQAAGGTLRTFAYGGIGQIKIAGDAREVEINAANADGQTDAGFGNVAIGGSLVGGAGTFSGQLYASGNIGFVKIGGDLVGGSGASSGQISAGGTIAGVTIGGSLRGGSFNAPSVLSSSGLILSGRTADSRGDVGFIKIGESIIGGTGDYSAQILVGNSFNGDLQTLTIGGDIVGGSGMTSGHVQVRGKSGNVQILGSIVGGSNSISGRLTLQDAGTVLVKGSIAGGDGPWSGSLIMANAKSLSVLGSVTGGDGLQSGNVYGITLGKTTLGGSLVGGAGIFAGLVQINGGTGALKVQGSILAGGQLYFSTAKSVVVGGDIAPGTDPTSRHGSIFGGLPGTLQIKGSVVSGPIMDGTPVISISAAKSVSIGGNLVGTPGAPALFTVNGLTNDPVALGALTVKGRVEHARVIVGNGLTDGVQVGTVSIGGDFIASSIAVGTTKGNDNIYGTSDDKFIENGANPISRIAALVIKGQALGTAGGIDSYVVMAEEVGKVRVHGVMMNLDSSTTPLGPTGDLDVIFAH